MLQYSFSEDIIAYSQFLNMDIPHNWQHFQYAPDQGHTAPGDVVTHTNSVPTEELEHEKHDLQLSQHT